MTRISRNLFTAVPAARPGLKARSNLCSLLLIGAVLSWLAAPAFAARPEKIEICHIPPDTPDNVQTILVGPNAAARHFVQHGDFEVGLECSEGIGECEVVGETVCVPGDDVCTASALFPPPEPTEETCDDGLDNDCDGLVDVEDSDCNAPGTILTCNGDLIGFENGIPASWTVVDNTGGTGIIWVTTADPACEIPNRTTGSGEAACADSDAAGTPAIPYDTELLSNPIDLTGFATAQLGVAAYYWDIIAGNDRFEIDIWDGSAWTNELSWDETHGTEDISLDLSSYVGLSNVQVRFRYSGDGFDWFAQVDDIGLTCVN